MGSRPQGRHWALGVSGGNVSEGINELGKLQAQYYRNLKVIKNTEDLRKQCRHLGRRRKAELAGRQQDGNSSSWGKAMAPAPKRRH